MTIESCEVAAASEALTSRPSLAYQYAFDHCAMAATVAGGNAVLFASSPFFASELLNRLAGQPARLRQIPPWNSPTFPLDTKSGRPIALPSSTVALWAGPEGDSGAATLAQIGGEVPSGGALLVITAGPLARFLPEWRRREGQAGVQPASAGQVCRWLRRQGFSVERRRAYHGSTSILWGYAARLLERLHRPELADRCSFRMRRSFATPGRLPALTAVGVVEARKR